MLAVVTLLSGIFLVAAAGFGYVKKRTLEYVFWLISGLAFFVISIALVILDLDALSLPITIYLGSIYPSFLALGLLYRKNIYWREYLGFALVLFFLIIVGDITQSVVKTIAQITLHSVSGLIIVLLPLYFVFIRRDSHWYLLLFSLGGLVIGIGGVALASLATQTPLLPFDLVVALLHPLLFISAFLIGFAVYLSIEHE